LSLTIKIPLRPNISEEEKLLEFLLKVFPCFFFAGKALGLTIHEVSRRENEDGIILTYEGMFKYVKARDIMTPLTIVINIRRGASCLDMKMTLNFKKSKPGRKELIALVSDLRHIILEYMDWKEKCK